MIPQPRRHLRLVAAGGAALRREDVEHVLATFPAEAVHADILTAFDAMGEASRSGAPYRSPLEIPPADPRVAHPPLVDLADATPGPAGEGDDRA